MTEMCEDCYFFELFLDHENIQELGWCKRYPPVYRGGDYDIYDVGSFITPYVHPENGCGEHKPRYRDSD